MTQILFSCFILLVSGILLIFNLLMSEKETNNLTKQTWFESGIENKISSRSSFSINFFLICIIFIMFDMEILFLFTFIFKSSSLMYYSYMSQFFFFFIFLYLSLLLEWKIDSISWKY